jgi:hypothetical protein
MSARLRSAGITAGVMLLVAGTAFGASPAHAAERETITVTWQVNAPDFAHRFDLPQTVPALNCGLHQVDVYLYDDTLIHTGLGQLVTAHEFVDNLLHLGELPSAGEDAPVYISNTDEDLGPCPTTPVTTAPPAAPPTDVPTAPTSSPTSTPTAPPTTVATTPSGPATTSPATPAGSRVQPNVTATTAVRIAGSTDPATLAFTGPRDMTEPAVIAGLAVLAGVVLTVRVAILRRRARKTGATS